MARKKAKGTAAPASAAPNSKAVAPASKGAASASVVKSSAASQPLLRYMPHTTVADPSALMPHHFLVKAEATPSTSQVEQATEAAATKERAATVPQTPAKAPLPPTCPPTVAAQKAEPKPEPRSVEPLPTATPASSSRLLLRDLMPHTAVADPAKLMPHHFLARREAAGVDAGADAADVDVVMDVEPAASAAAPASAPAPADTIVAAVAAAEARPSAVVQGAEAAVPVAPKQASNGSTSSTWLNVRLLAQRLRSALSCA